MKTDALPSLALTFSTLSLLAIGGASATAPEVQKLAVLHWHWMSAQEFSQVFAIAQAAPGPNVMLASLVGWKVAGLAGLIVATFCMNGPPAVLALVVGRGWRRWADSEWTIRLRLTLGPIAVGLIAASGLVMARTSDHAPSTFLISALMGGFVFWTRLNPLWGLAASAVMGVTLYQLGFPL